jgi:hypothetical protein
MLHSDRTPGFPVGSQSVSHVSLSVIQSQHDLNSRLVGLMRV